MFRYSSTEVAMHAQYSSIEVAMLSTVIQRLLCTVQQYRGRHALCSTVVVTGKVLVSLHSVGCLWWCVFCRVCSTECGLVCIVPRMQYQVQIGVCCTAYAVPGVDWCLQCRTMGMGNPSLRYRMHSRGKP